MRIRKAIFVLAAFGVFATVAYAAKGYDIEVIFGDLKVEGVQDDGTGKSSALSRTRTLEPAPPEPSA